MMDSQNLEKRCWETHSFEGCFSIDLPVGTRLHHEDENTVLRFELPTSPNLDLFAGVFPSPGSTPITQLVLRGEIDRFMMDCVGATGSNFETPADFDEEGFLSYQAVAEAPTSRWWIARVYARRRANSFLLVHSNGLAEQLRDIILPAFVSIDPVLTVLPRD